MYDLKHLDRKFHLNDCDWLCSSSIIEIILLSINNEHLKIIVVIGWYLFPKKLIASSMKCQKIVKDIGKINILMNWHLEIVFYFKNSQSVINIRPKHDGCARLRSLYLTVFSFFCLSVYFFLRYLFDFLLNLPSEVSGAFMRFRNIWVLEGELRFTAHTSPSASLQRNLRQDSKLAVR